MTKSLEIQRVADHIQRAEVMASQRDTSQLSYTRRLVRSLLLQALADYRAGGRIPKNRDFARRTPYFIDADGTRCAMAHLMELGGERDLVAKIARERNNAYVRELADEPALLAWLEAAGLTIIEAASAMTEVVRGAPAPRRASGSCWRSSPRAPAAALGMWRAPDSPGIVER